MKYLLLMAMFLISVGCSGNDSNIEKLEKEELKIIKNNNIPKNVFEKARVNKKLTSIEMVRMMNKVEKTNLSDAQIYKIAKIMDSMNGLSLKEKVKKHALIDKIKKGEDN